jgi:hypothetical protein
MTFIVNFRNLIRIPYTFKKVINSTVRIFKAVANSNENILLKYRVAYITYYTESYKAGFI